MSKNSLKLGGAVIAKTLDLNSILKLVVGIFVLPAQLTCTFEQNTVSSGTQVSCLDDLSKAIASVVCANAV